jgi:hypothetical protein
VLRVSNLKPSDDFSANNEHVKSLVDAYFNKVLTELKQQAQIISANKLIVESDLSVAVDSFLDLGFKVTNKGERTYVGEFEF